jgi:hypothetical protein
MLAVRLSGKRLRKPERRACKRGKLRWFLLLEGGGHSFWSYLDADHIFMQAVVRTAAEGSTRVRTVLQVFDLVFTSV